MPRPPPVNPNTRAVVLSLYRTCLRWTQLPLVQQSQFLASDLPPALAALDLPPRLLTNQQGVHQGIRTLFRAHQDERDPKVVSAKVQVALEGLQYLHKFTRTLEHAEARREANRDREGIAFRVGMVLRHRLFNYRCVVVGWDRRPTIDVSKWEGVVQTASREDQPFYHVVPDTSDSLHFLGGTRKLMYCAQENLEPCHALESRIHSDVISQAFTHFDLLTQSFVPTERIAWQYPADGYASPSTPPASTSVFGGGPVKHPFIQPHPHPHGKRLRISVQRAKLVDASRRMQRHLQELATKVWQQLEARFGALERFDAGAGDPVGVLLGLLKQLKDMPPAPGTSHKKAMLSGGLEEVLPGYDALRLLRDLFALSDDLHGSRRSSGDRHGVDFRLGDVVRHRTLGYRGLICGWDRFPKRPLPTDPPGLAEGHPHYRVIVNDQDRDSPSTPAQAMVVLSQEALEKTAVEDSAIVSPLIPENFEFFEPLSACYQPNPTLRFKFPADVSFSSASSDAASLTHAEEATRIVASILKVLLRVLIQARTKLPGHPGLKADLFSLLQGAMRKEDAEVVEGVIWSLWLAHPDEEVRQLLDDGIQFMLRAKYDEAVARFDAALARDGAFTEAYNKRGTAFFLATRYQESKADVSQTLSREPQHFGALIGKGLIDYEQGQKVQAIKAFRQTLRVAPWASNVGSTLHHTRKQLESEEVVVMDHHP